MLDLLLATDACNAAVPFKGAYNDFEQEIIFFFILAIQTF